MTTDITGGLWSHCLELITGLQRFDVRVTLACLGPTPSARQQAALDLLDNAELHVHEGRVDWMSEPSRVGAWLLELEQRSRPSLIHLNGYVHASLPWSRPALVVGHSCLLTRARALDEDTSGPRWDAYRQRVRAGLTAAGAVVTPTAWMLDQLLLNYGVRFDGLVINHACAAAYGPPSKPAQAAIFAHPTRYDPLARGPLEAARSGCALVLGDIPNLRELWGDAAVYVDPDDHDALASILAELIDDPDRCNDLSERARLRSARYSVERMVAAYHNLYLELVHGPRTQPLRFASSAEPVPS